MITGTDVTVWTISGLLAIGIGWSAYAKRKTRDKLVRELAAMEPDRREKVLQRLNPKLINGTLPDNELTGLSSRGCSRPRSVMAS